MIQLNSFYLEEPRLSQIAEILESHGFIVGIFHEKLPFYEAEPKKYSCHDYDSTEEAANLNDLLSK